ncbi:MAG: hypothetical protein M8860_06375 [marine benthic group bacterium]|jgi:hypothetical protein|nr:hypothetical protein [Gemmatimonadota bacterium]MCL7962460.1 hypothetical protein [Candidatus Carthagonibacter metallireducens]MCL7938673.1 hypothetical protein [Gemmatimonadota bacterium]MCL7956481.1 hypothetical protein [Gemmatimonadota bacterium]MCL7964001.1 hypothetical protein [Gemmatimonadota bacterium]
MSHDTPTAAAEGAAQVDTVTVRLVMPDRWLEHVQLLPLSTTLREAKTLGLRTLLQRSTDDPSDYYVEYAERRIRDEGLTLADLGFRPREILSIRAYDLGHYKRFEG